MKHTNFTKAFREGYSFKPQILDAGSDSITFSVHNIGNLVLTSGKLIACDPLLISPSSEGNEPFFTVCLLPNSYPILLSVATYNPLSKLPACAMLQVSSQVPVKWEVALRLGDDLEKGIYAYGVDSGTGCFMDADTLQALIALVNPENIKNEARQSLATILEVEERFEQEFGNRLVQEQDKNYANTGFDWTNLLVSSSTGANVITFRSGLGDGVYASYWGYDEADKVVCLVTDFMLFDEDSQIVSELPA
ncbi:MAG: DUF4241 domain-containing protein [Tildeniella nuda ZEHNDER 1965/U140]|jgi:hypothetical protein|nr:DUF4241 domain-containing protein [Tildeniella nuda ZEHNDER 1965/U140]